ncbi:LysR family transcriptional regulator [Actibacterium sp. 188UL27-1]|uniref:LysR family transcriptional regulator n=1 Tax=Actibacterium sp. 188UL27-1 TaxID=2786961 RepID=UPI00195E0FAD|nr:LysR family transcriptional regulator [Actibacterium sp. 188UL27-1]MBM7066113.1 LysR family transcriptional regulator [Actibacterium sp. 188UL27-1]
MSGHIEHVRTFLAVADHGGFAVAGRHLNLSPTIVTRHVAELEERLGVQLFLRTTRKVSLTEAGRLYRTQTTPVVAALDGADAAVRERHVGLSGPLRVSAPLSFGMRFLPEAMAQFRILHPAVAVNLQLSDRMVDIAAEGYDMALRISGPPSDQSTIWRKICPVPRLLVASPDYLAQHGAPERPDALARRNCLHYGGRTGRTVWTLSKGGTSHQVSLAPCLTCNNGETLARLTELGEGITLLPRFLVEDALERGTLRPVLAGWEAPPIWLTVTYPPYEALPAKVSAFTRFIETALQDRGMVPG